MITDKAIEPGAAVALTPIVCSITTATSQTGRVSLATIPGFNGQVEKVEAWATAVTAAITVDVAVGSTSVLSAAITPVADTVTAGTLSSTITACRFTSTDQLNFKYTTDSAGAATNLKITVWVRPYPMNGEA